MVGSFPKVFPFLSPSLKRQKNFHTQIYMTGFISFSIYFINKCKLSSHDKSQEGEGNLEIILQSHHPPVFSLKGNDLSGT